MTLPRATWWATAATAFTGLLLLPLSFLAPVTLPVMLAHLALGIVATAAAPLALARHLQATASPARSATIVLAGAGLLSVPVAAALHFPEPQSLLERQLQAITELDAGALVGTVSLLLLLGGATVLSATALGLRQDDRAAARRSGLAATAMTAWAIVSGLTLQLQHRDNVFGALTLHSLAGTGASAVLVLHLVTRLAARSRWPRPVLPILGALGLLLTAALWWSGYVREHFRALDPAQKGERFFLREMPSTALARAATLPSKDLPPLWTLGDSRSCGGLGCHEELVLDWLGSPHRHAGSNQFYRAALGEFVRERGIESAIFCATCHDPARAASGTFAEAVRDGLPPQQSDGVGCAVCHGVTAVHGDPPGNAAMSIAWDRDPIGHGALARLRTRLDPRHHRQRFVTRGTSLNGQPCLACHRVVVGRDLGLPEDHVVQHPRPVGELYGGAGTNCVTCHLPQDEDGLYRHRMAGVAADLALYAGDVPPDERAALQRQRSATTEFVGMREAPPWDRPPDDPTRAPPSTLEGRRRGAGPGVLRLDIDLSSEPGALRLQLRTMNLGIGHDFPAGPLDLHEVWLEAAAWDGTGRLLVHQGGLDGQGMVDPRAPRLGGRELRADGTPLPRHRLWELDRREPAPVLRDAILRQELRLVLPPDPSFPLTVAARWNLRRAPPAFSEWAGTQAGGAGLRLPTWELAMARRVVPGP